MEYSELAEPITCTLPELADLLRLKPETVCRLSKLGVLRKAKRGKYLLIESLAGHNAYLRQMSPNERKAQTAGPEGLDENHPIGAVAAFELHRAALYKERAEKARRDNEISAGKLHKAEAVEYYMGKMIAAFRSRVLAIPNDCAPLIPVEIRPEVRETIEESCRLACQELSEYDPKAVTAKSAEDTGDTEAEELEEKEESEDE